MAVSLSDSCHDAKFNSDRWVVICFCRLMKGLSPEERVDVWRNMFIDLVRHDADDAATEILKHLIPAYLEWTTPRDGSAERSRAIRQTAMFEWLTKLYAALSEQDDGDPVALKAKGELLKEIGKLWSLESLPSPFQKSVFDFLIATGWDCAGHGTSPEVLTAKAQRAVVEEWVRAKTPDFVKVADIEQWLKYAMQRHSHAEEVIKVLILARARNGGAALARKDLGL